MNQKSLQWFQIVKTLHDTKNDELNAAYFSLLSEYFSRLKFKGFLDIRS